jgi:hypothetical protein
MKPLFHPGGFCESGYTAGKINSVTHSALPLVRLTRWYRRNRRNLALLNKMIDFVVVSNMLKF